MIVCPLCEQPVEGGKPIWTSVPDILIRGESELPMRVVSYSDTQLSKTIDEIEAMISAIESSEVASMRSEHSAEAIIRDGRLEAAHDSKRFVEIDVGPPDPDYRMHYECYDELFE